MSPMLLIYIALYLIAFAFFLGIAFAFGGVPGVIVMAIGIAVTTMNEIEKGKA